MSTDPRRTVDAPTVNESPFPTSSDDPTATKTIRTRYGAEMYRRFRALKGAIVEGIVERDAFGIADLSPEERAGPRTPATFTDEYAANPLGPPGDPERFGDFEECVEAIQGDGTSEAEAERICGAWEAEKNVAANQSRRGGAGAGINIEPPQAGEFAFPSDARKVEAFLGWLARQENRGILGVDPGGTTRELAAAEAWQNTYLRQAYSKGVDHADAFLVQAGIIPPTQTLDNAFRAVKHSDAAGLIFTRAYNELDGVTDAMAQDMSRVLAEGLTQGLNPNEIARQLNDRVDNVGLHRGRLIARTETIRAHNEATLNRYEDMDARISGVTTLAEHITAGDNRVCPECAALSGTVYTIREARGRIPVHPNCRCTWVPVDAAEIEEEREAAFEEFLAADSTEDLLRAANTEPITGGFTLNSDLTPYEGEDLIATIASRQVDAFSPEAVVGFAEEWGDVTRQYPGITKIGAWHGEDGFKSLDLNIATGNRALAEAIGRSNNQQAIWDMGAMEPIMTGGTGDTVVDSTRGALDLIQSAIAEGAV